MKNREYCPQHGYPLPCHKCGYGRTPLIQQFLLTPEEIKDAYKNWPNDKPSPPTFEQWLCQLQIEKFLSHLREILFPEL